MIWRDGEFLDSDRLHDSLPPVTKLEALTSPHPARLSAKDFWLLAESGAFEQYARSELIEGEIFVVNSQFRRHAWFRRKLVRAFEDALAERAGGLDVLDECSVAFDDASVPEPDIVLTTEAQGAGPIPIASVRLIVEVSDTTLSHDLGRKQRLYAKHGIPEYWVADLSAERILRMWKPEGNRYLQRDEWAFGLPVKSATIAGLIAETISAK